MSSPSGRAIASAIPSAIAVNWRWRSMRSRTMSGLSRMYRIGRPHHYRAVDLLQRQRADDRLAVHHRERGRLVAQEEREGVAEVVMPPNRRAVRAAGALRHRRHRLLDAQ